ncbi:MAG: biopolymer transporter ExbD [bacterium]|nr:biopolymer transporter ExbD [bacterium]MCP4798975.1 biopolymer transporter ExbD [bacterium]
MKSNYSYESKVDVVPVINVSLVIVLTLMIISPFLSQTEHDLTLPEARASEVDDQDQTEVTFTIDREIYLGEDLVAFEDLRETLEPVFAANPDAIAVLKADKSIAYGEVELLIAEIEAAQAPRIAIATSKPGQGGDAQ